jgi:hypothetical protein
VAEVTFASQGLPMTAISDSLPFEHIPLLKDHAYASPSAQQPSHISDHPQNIHAACPCAVIGLTCDACSLTCTLLILRALLVVLFI